MGSYDQLLDGSCMSKVSPAPQLGLGQDFSDANIALASQDIPRPNMTERDPTPALKTQQLHETKEGNNVPNLNALKPPIEENSSKVKTERHTKTPG